MARGTGLRRGDLRRRTARRAAARATGSRSRRPAARLRCCIRPATTISGCCAPSSTGVAAASLRNDRNAEAPCCVICKSAIFAIIDAVEIDFSLGPHRAHRRDRRRQIDHWSMRSNCSAAGAPVPRWCEPAPSVPTSAPASISRSVGGELRHVLDEQSIAHEGELLLRRVIGSDGRSRAWLNGQSVPVHGAAQRRRAAVRHPWPA